MKSISPNLAVRPTVTRKSPPKQGSRHKPDFRGHKNASQKPERGKRTETRPSQAQALANTHAHQPPRASHSQRAERPPRTPLINHGKPIRPDSVLIFGFHAVREALRSERRTIRQLWATQAAADKLSPELAAKNITPHLVSTEDIAQNLPHDSVHQGLLAEAAPLESLDLEDIPASGLVLVLDQVTDPHNVGSIMRTAAAFNVDALITTERHSPALTGILAKTASGALEHLPIVHVVNLARALEKIGDMGYQRIGLDSEGPHALDHIQLTRPLALVLGAEGKGLRRLTRENCDHLARLDMPGQIKSLNVSNACAVALTIAHGKLMEK
jgi:23S rRNA (guanosine2251-2'-O)-methyltransferase